MVGAMKSAFFLMGILKKKEGICICPFFGNLYFGPEKENAYLTQYFFTFYLFALQQDFF